MPVHRIPRAEAEDAYKRIARGGETVNHIVVDGDEYVFFTSPVIVTTIKYVSRPDGGAA